MPTIRTVAIPKQYKHQEEPRQFKVFGNLRWEMTDEYGYPVKLAQIRNERIESVLSDDNSADVNGSIRYSIALRKIDEEGWGHYTIELWKGKLSLIGEHLAVKLNCVDLIEAEGLIKLLIDGNNLEVMPVHRAGFRR